MHKTLALSSLLMMTVAACGGSGTPNNASGDSAGGAGAAASGAVVKVAGTSLGRVLVDGRGRTLYLLTADSAGHSTCAAQCQAYWPPVAVPSPLPHTLPGVTGRVGSTALPGGGRTLTVGGRPLYTFVQDGKPGDVTGQGVASFGGVWYVVSPAGTAVKGAPSSSAPTSRSGY